MTKQPTISATLRIVISAVYNRSATNQNKQSSNQDWNSYPLGNSVQNLGMTLVLQQNRIQFLAAQIYWLRDQARWGEECEELSNLFWQMGYGNIADNLGVWDREKVKNSLHWILHWEPVSNLSLPASVMYRVLPLTATLRSSDSTLFVEFSVFASWLHRPVIWPADAHNVIKLYEMWGNSRRLNCLLL